MKRLLIASVALLAASAASAATPTPTATPESDSLLPGGNSKEPISIEADKLVYSDKDFEGDLQRQRHSDPGRQQDELLGVDADHG